MMGWYVFSALLLGFLRDGNSRLRANEYLDVTTKVCCDYILIWLIHQLITVLLCGLCLF